MVGFALSGVVLALFRDAFARRGETLLAALPALLVATAAIGFHFTTTNPFNPLQLQNLATWAAAALEHRRLLRLPAAVLLPGRRVRQPELRAERRPHRPGLWLRPDRRRRRRGVRAGGDVRGARVLPGAAAAGAAGGERLLRRRTLALGRRRWRRSSRCSARRRCCCSTTRRSSTTSRRSTRRCTRPTRASWRACCRRAATTSCSTTSPSASTPTSPTTPACSACRGRRRRFGLYRDGNRIAALPKPGTLDVGYAAAALDALPYQLIPHANVLLAGASGGFRIAELLALGAAQVRVLEPEPVLLRALQHGLGPSPAVAERRPRVSISGEGPVAAVRGGGALRRHRSVGRFPRRRRGQRDGVHRARRSPATCARWRRAASCPSRSRSATFRSMRCACWRPCARRCWPPASPIRRRTPWSIAPPGACASCCPTARGTPRGSPR